MRLSSDTIGQLPPDVAVPAFDRGPAHGIVHFGIGAFHRAHQAWYTDACLNAGDAGWTITGVSLRSASVAEQLVPQHGLYTLTERSAAGAKTRVIGAVADVLVAANDRDSIVERITSPTCHLVSFTVTEKGYCRAPDGSLDLALAESGFYPILADALARRKAAGLPGLTLLSCDNLSGNGKQLGRLMGEWLAANAPALTEWFSTCCTTPDSMVDRIVPASTEADIAELESRIGLRDEGAVFTEPFSQWVIEDSFAGPRPRWEDHGAQIVDDVAPYETAKLRMLNGAHSLLAYLGLRAGHEFVHQAVADANLRRQVEALMRSEAAPTIAAGEGQDLGAYAEALLARFANPSLNHRLAQIAMDGSQKIRQRWLETLAAHGEGDAQCTAIIAALGAWIVHVRGDNPFVDDPLAGQLAALWASEGETGIVAALLGTGGLFADSWQPSPAARKLLEQQIIRSSENA